MVFRGADSRISDPRTSLLRMKFWGFFTFIFSPSYSSVPAVHLITTGYTTVVRTRECVCVREAGAVTAALTD